MRIVLAAAIVLALGGCESQADSQVLVSAAASLTDAFASIETAYELANPAVDLVLNLAGSSLLREQILEGAPVAIFASASLSNMDQVVAAGETVGEPRVFALNRLQIAVPAGNPAGVVGLEDLAREDLLIGLCAATVPCGDFARETLAAAGVVPAVDTNEADVRSLLAKIGAGDLDAGVTYVSDVVSSQGTVEGIDIPAEVNVVAEYPIAVLAKAPNREAAGAFVDFVLSDDGRAIMTEYGFSSP